MVISGNALCGLERSWAAGLLGNSPQIGLIFPPKSTKDGQTYVETAWKKGLRIGVTQNFESNSWNGKCPVSWQTQSVLGVDRMWKAAWRFEVNIYHCLLLHGFLIFGAPQTKSEMSNFRNRVSYLVGSRRCTRHGSHCNICKISLHPHSHCPQIPDFSPWQVRPENAKRTSVL